MLYTPALIAAYLVYGAAAAAGSKVAFAEPEKRNKEKYEPAVNARYLNAGSVYAAARQVAALPAAKV